GRFSACSGYRSRRHRRRAGAGGRAGAGSGRGAPRNPFRGYPRINGVRCLQKGIARGIWRGHQRHRCLYREIRARPAHRVPRTLQAFGSARPALSVAVSRRRRPLPRGRRQGSSRLLPVGRWAKCRPHQQSANSCGGGGVRHSRGNGRSAGEASTRRVSQRWGRVNQTTARRTRARLTSRSTGPLARVRSPRPVNGSVVRATTDEDLFRPRLTTRRQILTGAASVAMTGWASAEPRSHRLAYLVPASPAANALNLQRTASPPLNGALGSSLTSDGW